MITLVAALTLGLQGVIHRDGDDFKRCLYPDLAAPRLFVHVIQVPVSDDCPLKVRSTVPGERAPAPAKETDRG